MSSAIRRFPYIWRATRLARRWYRARIGAYPDWAAVLAGDEDAWATARQAATGRPRILLSSAIGSQAHVVTLESALAVALTLRGAEVEVLLCDKALPACAECDASLYPDMRSFARCGPNADLCRECYWPAERVFRTLGLRTHRLTDWLADEDRRHAATVVAEVPFANIREYCFEGLAVGQHAYAGCLRFFARGSLDGEPHAEPILRRYFEAALLTAIAMRRIFRARQITCTACTHGIYVPWGIMGEAARADGVRVVNWNVAYRQRRFIFSHQDTYHYTLMSEPASLWDWLPLTNERQRALTEYLESRREGLFDWIAFHRGAVQDPRRIREQLRLDPARPVIGLLTNVYWDAQVHYPANAFPNMLEWIVRTCEYFAKRPDLQLVVRVHPAEVSGFPPSRQQVADELRLRMSALPPNVIIVPPDSPISTYGLMSLCNAAIIYGTKTGVELTSVGIPVLVAGEAWIRNKGITYDARNPEEYFALLDRLPFTQPLKPDILHRARQYAYHFFFRRMIPLGFVKPRRGYPIYRLCARSLDDLRPGMDRGLDAICAGVLEGKPFVYDEAEHSRSASDAMPIQEAVHADRGL